MGFAENQVSMDLLESWLAENPDGMSIFRELALFPENHVSPALKKAFVDFMVEITGSKVTFDPNHIVLTDGATSACEILTSCLVEQREALLLTTPFDPGFDRDFKWPTGSQIVPIQCKSSNNFQINLWVQK